jgi:glucokinase
VSRTRVLPVQSGRSDHVTDPIVVGVDLGGSNVRAAAALLNGDVLTEVVERTNPAGGEAVVVQIARLIRGVTAKTRRRGSDVVAVAVGVPGFVPAAGGLIEAVNIKEFSAYPLRAALMTALEGGFGEGPVGVDGGPDESAGFAVIGPISANVVVENDVNVAALGELDQGGFGTVDSLVVLSVGTGVGAGVVVGNQIVRGAHGAAGEVAFLPIGSHSASTRRQGALESVASGPAMQIAIVEAVRSAADNGVSTVLTEASSPADALSAAPLGDAVAQQLVAQECVYLADAVVAICAVVDPEVVVLTGGLGSNPMLLDPLRAAIAVIAPYEIRLTTSRLGDRSGLVGAVALARRMVGL